MDLSKDDRVEMPTKPDWGMGRVVQNPALGKVSVHFRDAGVKVLSLKHAKLNVIEGDEAIDVWLDNLIFDVATEDLRYIGPKQALTFFLTRYPGGFEDPGFVEEHRDPKFVAHNLFMETLDRGEAAGLIEREEFDEYGKRLAKIVSKTNLVYPVEKSAFNKAVKDSEKCAALVQAVHQLVYGDERPDVRFKHYCDALGAIGAARWTLATYFTFIRYPEEHILLKPTYTQQAAALCRFDLQYKSEPNRATYGRMLAFARVLSDVVVADLKPRDMFDVQGFIWSIPQDKG